MTINTKTFNINFSQIDAVIGIMAYALDANREIKFIPETNSYEIDGISFSANFFAETSAKFSQYINITNKVIIKANDAYQETVAPKSNVDVKSLLNQLYVSDDNTEDDGKTE